LQGPDDGEASKLIKAIHGRGTSAKSLETG